MKWISYFLLAYLAVGVQIGAAAFMRVNGAAPNIVLIVAIFLAMNAPAEPAMLACFMLGLMTDLVSQQPMGLYAFSFGLVAFVTTSLSQMVYRGNPLTHFFLAMFGGMVCAIVLWLQSLIHHNRLPMLGLLGGALFTALLAPIVLGVLHRLRGVFGFETGRRR